MLLNLNRSEPNVATIENNFEGTLTAPAWVLEGIEIEIQQYVHVYLLNTPRSFVLTNLRNRVQQEARRVGLEATAKQALDLFNMQSNLSGRIARHHQASAHFIDLLAAPSSVLSSATEDDGKPEVAALCLASHSIQRLAISGRNTRIKATEVKLRRAKCLQSLQRLCTASLQKAQMLRSKKVQRGGQATGTRIQSMLSRLSARMDGSIADYSTSRRALLALSNEPADKQIFLKLTLLDTSGLMGILSANCEPGEGYKKLPWFWTVRIQGQDNEVASQEEEMDGK